MLSIARSANSSRVAHTLVAAVPNERPPEIPRRLSQWERFGIASRALCGSLALPNHTGPIDRAVAAWQWTDHRRRLQWLASRPRLHRTVIVGVVGHRSDDVAQSLTTSLGQVRHDRIVLMAGQPPFHHAVGPSTATYRLEDIESGLRDPTASSAERDALFARTDEGALFIPLERSSQPPDVDSLRRLLTALASHAGVVIIDGGDTLTSSPLATDACDQIIWSTTGPPRTFPAQTIVATWSDQPAACSAQPHATVQVGDGPDSMLELAVVSIAGWADFDAATPMPLGR